MSEFGERVFFGDGHLSERIGDFCGSGRVLLVAGSQLFGDSGAEKILDKLDAQGTL